jgi:hypothetical protein
VAAVVASFVRHDAKELVFSLLQQTAKRQLLWKYNLGGVLL